MANRVYRVKGLDCAEEAATLRRQLGGRAGILRLDFDLINARMTVEYDPQVVSPQEIEASVASTGMRAIPWEQRWHPHVPRGGLRWPSTEIARASAQDRADRHIAQRSIRFVC
jgi:copper chaperone CopZ